MGEGLQQLNDAIRLLCMDELLHQWVRIPTVNGKLRSSLYRHGKVLRERTDESGDLILEVEITRQNLELVQREEGVTLEKESDKQIINSCG
jgi:50S ribosomal subunit-associated GTPase HflX